MPSTLKNPYRLHPPKKLRKLPQNPVCGCMGFHFPYHEMWEVGAPDRVSLLHPQQVV